MVRKILSNRTILVIVLGALCLSVLLGIAFNRKLVEGHTIHHQDNPIIVSAVVGPRTGAPASQPGVKVNTGGMSGAIIFNIKRGDAPFFVLLDTGWSGGPSTFVVSEKDRSSVAAKMFPDVVGASQPCHDGKPRKVCSITQNVHVSGEGSANTVTVTEFITRIITPSVKTQNASYQLPVYGDYLYKFVDSLPIDKAINGIVGTNFFQSILMQIPYSDSLGNHVTFWNTAEMDAANIIDKIAEQGYTNVMNCSVTNDGGIGIPVTIGGAHGVFLLDTGYQGPAFALYPSFWKRASDPPVFTLTNPPSYDAIRGVASVFCEQFGTTHIGLGEAQIPIPMLRKETESEGQGVHGVFGSSMLSYLFDGIMFTIKYETDGKWDPQAFFGYKLRGINDIQQSNPMVLIKSDLAKQHLSGATIPCDGQQLDIQEYCSKCGKKS